MKHRLLHCLIFLFRLYLRGIALLAIGLLWPAHVLMSSRLAEAAPGHREFAPLRGRGEVRPDPALTRQPWAYDTETGDATPANAVLIEFAV